VNHDRDFSHEHQKLSRSIRIDDLTTAQWSCLVGLLAAMSATLMGLTFPWPYAPYLKYEPADIPAYLATLYMGVSGGSMVVLLRCLLTILLINPDVIGVFLGGVAGWIFILVAGLVLGRARSRTRRALAAMGGLIAVCCGMGIISLAVLPLYTGWPMDRIYPEVLSVILPFNIFKVGLNILVTSLVLRRLPNLPAPRKLPGPAGDLGQGQ